LRWTTVCGFRSAKAAGPSAKASSSKSSSNLFEERERSLKRPLAVGRFERNIEEEAPRAVSLFDSSRSAL
jgi:hypothetical protein